MSANFWNSSHCEQWIFSKQDLLRMRAEDLKNFTEEEYAKFMIFWANFIQNLVTDAAKQGHPTIRMQVIGTAVVFFKRFFIRRAFKDLDPFALCCVCVLLASKAEEHGQVSVTKLSQLVPQVLLKHYNARYELKSPIPYDIEFIIVETMDCCLIVFQPYRPLKDFLEDLRSELNKDINDLEAQSWKVVNDSFRTDACLLFAPHIIAVACIIVGASLMDKDNLLKNWLPELAIDLDQVYECVVVITNMYTVWQEFKEKVQVQALIDKLPKINGDPPPGWGRSSSSAPPTTTSQSSFFGQFPQTTQASSSMPGPSGSGTVTVTTTGPSTSTSTTAFAFPSTSSSSSTQ